MAKTKDLKLTDLIREAHKLCNVNNASIITATIMHGELWRKLEADREAHRYATNYGIYQLSLVYLKHIKDDEDNGASPDQLSFWKSDRHRQIVKQINRERVYVPSRHEHVLLRPDQISKPEVLEAGDYLIDHGTDCVREGKLLRKLAKLGGPWSL
jgi:hypothetical protein